MSIRLLLVDDHVVVRQGLRMFLGPDPAFPGHLGLTSMRERALRMGGSLAVESAPG